tara:strand:+ start:331 stop:753 length:423 start_codon:yes stop_codon:yes gene_type:complete
MKKKFEQLSIKKGFMQHNGGLFFRKISKNEYEFKTKIKKNHLNAAGITHGGYIASIIDAGAGTAAHRSANKLPCVTIALDIKFVGITKLGENISGFTKILKRTKTLIFLICHLESKGKIIASASGIWKIMKKIPGAGYGG